MQPLYGNENQIDEDTFNLGQLQEVTIKNNNIKKLTTLETLKKFYTENKTLILLVGAILTCLGLWKIFKK